MADRAKRAAALAGMVSLIALGALNAPRATASMVAWSWDEPTDCQRHALRLPTTTGTTPSIWRKPHYFEAQANTPAHWGWARFDGTEWQPSISQDDLNTPGVFPSAGWGSLSLSYAVESVELWHPIPFYDVEDENLVDALDDWFPDCIPVGVRSNYCLYMPPRPGDFLPPSPTIGGGSYALVPNAAVTTPTTWNGLSRPTLGGVVDLITGVPLVQVTDLELPFAGSTFRLNRTRSYDRSFYLNALWGAWQTSSIDRWWDWAGEGWMISENPFILVDAYLGHAVPFNQAGPTTWVVLDAHSSIPFQRLENGEYEAPPRFQAVLKHNGADWNGSTQAWGTPPTQFDLYLYGGELHYIFVVVREDVPPRIYSSHFEVPGTHGPTTSLHDREYYAGVSELSEDYNSPFINGPGFGVPYIGQCVRIEDRTEHRVEIEYVGSKSVLLGDARDDPMINQCSGPTEVTIDDAETGDCVEYAESVLTKGQIKYIKLRDKSGAVLWTLFYTYRGYKGLDDFSDGACWTNLPAELVGQLVLDRIYVYEGDVAALTESSPSPRLFKDNYYFDGPSSSSEWAEANYAIGVFNSDNPNNQLPTNWKYQVRYHYMPSDVEDTESAPLYPLRLVKTSVRHSDTIDTLNTVRESIFEYSDLAAGESVDMGWLSAVYREEDLSRIAALSADTTHNPDDNHLIGVTRDEISLGTITNSETLDALHDQAWFWMMPKSDRTWSESSGIEYPDPTLMFTSNPVGPAYLSRPPVQMTSDNVQTVGRLSLRTDAGTVEYYQIHRLTYTPFEVASGGAIRRSPSEPVFYDSDDSSTEASSRFGPMHSAFLSPYWWHALPITALSGSTPTNDQLLAGSVVMTEPRWIAVVDGFPDRDSIETTSYTTNSAVKPTQRSRQVLEMNAGGYILRDRRWEFGDSGTTYAGTGLGEEFVYETAAEYFDGTVLPEQAGKELLLVEKRSVGWSAVPENEQAQKGLIEFYDYGLVGPPGTTDWSAKIRTIAEGVQKGTQGTPKYYRSQVLHAYEENARQATACEIKFLEPTTSLLQSMPSVAAEPSSSYSASYSLTWYKDSPSDKPWYERAATSRQQIRPPVRQRPGGSWYYPVEREFYDEDGNPRWSATGLVLNPLNPSTSANDPLASLTLTCFIHASETQDSQKRLKFTVGDAVPNLGVTTAHGASFTVPEDADLLDTNWHRIPSTQVLPSVANRATIEYVYKDPYGLSDTLYPNGRRWARRIVVQQGEQPFAREYIFNDLEESGGLWYARSPGEVNDFPDEYPYGTPLSKSKVIYSDSYSFNPESFDEPSENGDYEKPWQVTLAPDQWGRLHDATLLERNANGQMVAVGTKNINDFVDVYREREMDGTITRTVKNMLGQPMRVYVGTNDDGWTEGAGNFGSGFNMILTQRNEWGSEPNNAWLPTVARRYRANPDWYDDFYGPGPTGSDDDGYATVTAYDWRMRAVRVDSYSQGDPAGSNPPARLSTTLTYLDHADRTRFVVTFGSDALPDLSQLAPETLDSLESLNITAATFFALTTRPTSVAEMFYGPDGSMVERRTYDMGWTYNANEQPPYQAERHCFGRGGVEVFTQMPGTAISIKTLDPLGRVASVASIAPRQSDTDYTFEITRTDNAYDGDGNVAESVRWDRVDPQSTTAALSTANAVATKTVTWYDPQKRVVATAELGTQATSYTNPLSGGYTIFGANGSLDTAPAIVVTSGVASVENNSSLPPFARLNLSYYDPITAYRTYSADPSGAITKYEYNRLGSIAKRTENPTASDTTMRTTEYSYALGRLATMKTYAKSGNSQLSQVTEVQYGADVMAETSPGEYAVVSRNNGLIKSMHLPGSDGSPASSSHVYLRYDFEGRVVERHDARAVVFRYRYDSLGRLASITVGHYNIDSGGGGSLSPYEFVPGYPDDMTQADDPPADRVGYVEFVYDSAGDLYQTIAKELPTSSSVIATDQYERDTRRNISAEYQGLGLAAIDNDTPKVQYSWTHTNTGTGLGDVGQTRLASMTYPVHPLTNGAARTLTLTYGSSYSPEDILSRLTQVTTNIGTSSVAQLAYTGGGLRTKTTLGATKIVQDYKLGTEVGYAGIDSFGRPGDLHYKNTAATPTTLFRAKYTYDRLGQRLSAEITQIAAGSGSGETGANKRSQLLGYDALGRLNSTRVGALVDNSGTLTIPSPVRTDTWYLDELGNWNQNGPGDEKGRYSTGNLDAYGTAFSTAGADSGDDVGSLLLATDRRNRITEATSVFDSGTPVATQFTYDKHGNLEFDGTYYYQYDAWSRLVQVSRAELMDPPPTEGEQYLNPATIVMVKHFTYDGLGRLVRTQSPYPDPDTSDGRVFSERYYYDGVRRIQEVTTTPLASSGMAMSQGGELNQILNQTNGASATPTDGESTPVAFEQGQVAAAAGGGGPSGEIAVGVAREYVWGPGDRGIDELLIQYDKNRKAWYAIQDAGGDVVALCDVPTSGTARVAGQWTYDAYGNVIFAEHLVSHQPLHCGHKAAFVERLDVGVYSSSSSENHRLIPFAHSISHMRNRVYAPGIGRYLQPDPNATAAVLLDASSYHGRGIGATLAAFSMEDMYGDGMNLYEYLGSNPVNRSDPMGLSWDPFDALDDYLAESAGSTAAFMNNIGMGAKAVAVVAATIASYLPFPFVGNLGDLALYALGEQSGAELAGAMALGLIPGGKLGKAFGKIGSFLGRIGSAAWSAAKSYATRFAKAAANGFLDLGRKALNWVRKACGCFEPGTEVWTIDGPKPIEQIEVGDEVFAYNSETDDSDIRKVTRVFTRFGAPIVALTLTVASGEMVTLNTTEEHPFHTPSGWVAVGNLAAGDSVTTASGEPAIVTQVSFTDRLAAVHNFAVEGLHSYYVNGSGIVVHNTFIPCFTDVLKHAWDHASEFAALGIHTFEEFQSFIQNTVTVAGEYARSSSGKDIWYHVDTNTIFIINPNGTKHLGTAFRPKRGRAYFEEILQQ